MFTIAASTLPDWIHGKHDPVDITVGFEFSRMCIDIEEDTESQA